MKQKVNPASSIYQYQLLKKVNWSAPARLLYMGIGLGAAAWFIILDPALNTLRFFAVVPVVFGLHWLAQYLLIWFRNSPGSSSKIEWSIRWLPPLWGRFPTQHVSLRRLTSLQLHSLFIGVVIIGCLFPWVDIPWMAALLFLHLWIMAPGIISLFLCFRTYPDGLVKVNLTDVSCYKS